MTLSNSIYLKITKSSLTIKLHRISIQKYHFRKCPIQKYPFRKCPTSQCLVAAVVLPWLKFTKMSGSLKRNCRPVFRVTWFLIQNKCLSKSIILSNFKITISNFKIFWYLLHALKNLNKGESLCCTLLYCTVRRESVY